MKGSAEPAVLVVEDESALSTLLRYNLEREGYRVFEGKDGEEALILADEIAPDLIVLDWMLPQISGIEVCRRLRSRGHMRNRPGKASCAAAHTPAEGHDLHGLVPGT